MAHFDLEEQEQLDSIKTWWKMYGNLVTSIVTAAAVAVVGWQAWQWYQRNQITQASAIFAVLEEAISAKDAQRIKATATELTDKYAGTPYATLGALAAGKASFDAGDLKTARLQLSWAAENGKNEMKDIARLRLSSVLIDDKAYDEALKVLEAPHAPSFNTLFNELKGEAFLAKGKKEEARNAFKAALTSFEDKQKAEKGSKEAKSEEGVRTREEFIRGPYRELLEKKIDALGEKA